MLQTVQTLSNHLTKTDTLQAQIKHLNHIVDSLNVVSATTTIGTSYFHDVIGGTFTSFVGFIAIIVTIVGFVSWKFISDNLQREIGKIKNDLESRMSKNEEKFNKLTEIFIDTIKNLDKNSITLDIASQKAMYVALQDKDKAAATAWALSIVELLVKNEDIKAIPDWLKQIKYHVTELAKSDVEILFDRVKESIDNLKKNLQNDNLKILREIEDGIFKVMYSNEIN